MKGMIQKYAELAIRKGVNLQKDKFLLLMLLSMRLN